MGLDMYLLDGQEYKEYKEKIRKCDPDSSEIWRIPFPTELIYWRKANAIHRYFCSIGKEIEKHLIYEISKDQLLELVDFIKLILNSRDSEGDIFAKLIIPVQDGPFFGSIEYDEYYYSDLEYTKEKIENVLKSSDKDSFIYYASW